MSRETRIEHRANTGQSCRSTVRAVTGPTAGRVTQRRTTLAVDDFDNTIHLSYQPRVYFSRMSSDATRTAFPGDPGRS